MIAVSESIRRFKCFFFNDTATTEIYTLSLHDALPIFTVVALQFGALLGGSVIVETVFSWPGAGWLLMQGVYARDLPVVRRSEEHTSELQSRQYLVCRLLLEKKTTSQQHSSPFQSLTSL